MNVPNFIRTDRQLALMIPRVRTESEDWAAERARIANPGRSRSSWILVLIGGVMVAVAILVMT